MLAILAMMLTITDEPRPIDLGAELAAGRLHSSGADVQKARGGVKVTFQPEQWPGIYLTTPEPQNWGAYDFLAIDVENPGKEAVAFNLRIDDVPESDGKTGCTYGSATVRGGEKATFVCSFGRKPMDFGMRAFPPIPGATWMAAGSEKIAAKHVCKWLVFLSSPRTAQTLIIRNVRLESEAANLEGVVDRFGQFANATWPGKVMNEAELDGAARTERRQLRAQPALPNRDAYGGWSTGPKLEATGRFRTVNVEGKWWFVDPDGHLFWSLGVDCVNNGETTMVSGREPFFQWLPKKEEALGRFWSHANSVHSGPTKSGDVYDFRRANLYRKYGERWSASALERAADRLRAWGYNTIANWSDSSTWALKKVPYVVTVHVNGPFKTILTGGDYWGPIHDVFDPRFAESVVRCLASAPKTAVGDPWCLGWFVDNELSWAGSGEENGRFGIAYGALRAGPDSPAKHAFLDLLKAKYIGIEALNRAWGTNYASWQVMEPPLRFTEADAPKRKEDLIAFVKLYAEKYFKTVGDALHELDPRALYLGTRFAWYGRDSVEVSAKYCDVVSFNIYKETVDPKGYSWLSALGKPCIVGEFHFGALDRGMFHTGLVAAADQNDRAAKYTAYVHSVADNPAFVGCHWFQYADSPVLGRALDGENYNIGLVSVADVPYRELVAAAKKVNAEVYRRRFGAKESDQ